MKRSPRTKHRDAFIHALGEHGAWFKAAAAGDAAAMRHLIGRGAVVNVSVPISKAFYETAGRRALHFAAECGDTEAARVSLSHGAGTEVRDSFGLTPLALATGRGRLGVAGLLLTRDADGTPLMWAAARGDLATAELLLARGAAPVALDEDYRSAGHHALEHGHTAVAELLASAGTGELR